MSSYRLSHQHFEQILNELEVFRDFDPSAENDGPKNATHACDVYFVIFPNIFSFHLITELKAFYVLACF